MSQFQHSTPQVHGELIRDITLIGVSIESWKAFFKKSVHLAPSIFGICCQNDWNYWELLFMSYSSRWEGELCGSSLRHFSFVKAAPLTDTFIWWVKCLLFCLKELSLLPNPQRLITQFCSLSQLFWCLSTCSLICLISAIFLADKF